MLPDSPPVSGSPLFLLSLCDAPSWF
jgi:hypothetical protein